MRMRGGRCRGQVGKRSLRRRRGCGRRLSGGSRGGRGSRGALCQSLGVWLVRCLFCHCGGALLQNELVVDAALQSWNH